jgi:hypothetical protein
MEPTNRRTGPLSALRTTLEGAYYWLRRVLGLVYSVLLRDTLTRLRVDVEQLGEAAVESTSYVGTELRRVEERLERLEDELAALRELLEQRHSVSDRPGD